jgi:hypothetical protein
MKQFQDRCVNNMKYESCIIIDWTLDAIISLYVNIGKNK